MPTQPNTIQDRYLNLLQRPTRSVMHFSDVFPNEADDFDAVITASRRNVGHLSDQHFGIGHNPRLAEYAGVLLDDLEGEERRIVEVAKTLAQKENRELHPDARAKEDRLKQAPLAVLNCAPRNNDTTKGGKNGRDFHLAISASGVEHYAVPTDMLRALETRDRILALFRIKQEGHPFFDGNCEQFRSSVITTSRMAPEVLEPIFQYGDLDELRSSKAKGVHPNVIPVQKNLIEPAFADKFGNVRLSVSDVPRVLELIERQKRDGVVGIRAGDRVLNAHRVSCLSEIPEGELGIYGNVADGEQGGAGYLELVRKAKDPNNEPSSAVVTLGGLKGDISIVEPQ